MQQTRKTPTFNMKAVVRETGIKPDTLRAWERRYELPNPERTEGGHRIYSQRDVDTLNWLLARQAEGLSISHAVELFKRLESEGQDPLVASGYGRPGETGEVPVTMLGDTVQEMRDAWIAACRAFDEAAADRILSEAFALFPTEQVCIELLQKGMSLIGQGWYVGDTTVQQEHFASALAMRRLEALLAGTPPASRPGRVLLGCPPQEEHTFGLMLLAVLLRRRGIGVVYLGANVPAERLGATIATVRPRLAVFQAQQLISAAELRDLSAYLLEQQLAMAFGGRIFVDNPSLQQRISGQYLGDELLDATGKVEQLIGRSFESPPAEPVPEEYVEALDHFRARRAAIDSALATTLAIEGQSPDQFASAADFLTRNVAAALKLGDLDLLAGEIGWIDGLLNRRDVAPALLGIYLSAFRQALIDALDQRGQIIVDWFDELLASL